MGHPKSTHAGKGGGGGGGAGGGEEAKPEAYIYCFSDVIL